MYLLAFLVIVPSAWRSMFFCSHALPELPGTSLVRWLPDDDPPGCISDALRCSVFASSPGSLARRFYRESHHRHTSHWSVWFRWNASTSLTFLTNLRFKYCIIFNLTNLPFRDKAAKSRASSKTARCPSQIVFLQIVISIPPRKTTVLPFSSMRMWSTKPPHSSSRNSVCSPVKLLDVPQKPCLFISQIPIFRSNIYIAA